MKPSMEPDARARFVREAEALSALRHPAIIRVMGFSEEPRRGLLYLVMELADGETLKRRLERGPMALPEALATFVPLAGGLEHAHAEGISHRDLKPSNVILTPEGPLLVDFGIAAAANTGELTGAGHIGTLSYLPPEVFRGERAEPRMIDVYGFGLLFNEALTGVHPFPLEPGMTPAAALATVGMRKLQQPALDPGEGLPQAVRDLVRRATDSKPSARPDMAEIRRVLASLVERRAGSMAATAAAPGPAAPARVPAWSPPADATMRVPDPVLPPGRVPMPMRDGTTSHTRRRFRERRRSVIVAWVASMLAAALMAALIILMVRGSGGGSAGPESSPSPTASPAGAPAATRAPLLVATPRPGPSAAGAAGLAPTASRDPSASPERATTPPPSAPASPRVEPSRRPSPPPGAPTDPVVRPPTPTPAPSPSATPPPEEESPEPSPSPVVSPSPPAF
jgi:hypothetical protein